MSKTKLSFAQHAQLFSFEHTTASAEQCKDHETVPIRTPSHRDRCAWFRDQQHQFANQQLKDLCKRKKTGELSSRQFASVASEGASMLKYPSRGGSPAQVKIQLTGNRVTGRLVWKKGRGIPLSEVEKVERGTALFPPAKRRRRISRPTRNSTPGATGEDSYSSSSSSMSRSHSGTAGAKRVPLEEEDMCFTVVAQSRSVHLQTSSAADCNTWIRGLNRVLKLSGRRRNSLELEDAMKIIERNPHEVAQTTFSDILRRCVDHEDSDMARRTIEAMKNANNGAVRMSALTSLLGIYCCAGELEKSVSLLDIMFSQNFRPPVGCVCKVIRLQCNRRCPPRKVAEFVEETLYSGNVERLKLFGIASLLVAIEEGMQERTNEYRISVLEALEALNEKLVSTSARDCLSEVYVAQVALLRGRCVEDVDFK